ncbi:hypothetical protein BYT27DRAFT_7219930 [Phlegmacium glaucopus]|nr:hypothetical protein BYT27DRAFT_7219930 [Phlegmacium glaucopus]
MPPLRQTHSSSRPTDLLNPYPSQSLRPITPIPPSFPCPLPIVFPAALVEQIHQTQGTATSKSTQTKDVSRLCEFLAFCLRLSIPSNHALPVKEDLLITWSSSYSGRLAGKTVSAKISSIKKEHSRRGLPWYGGDRLKLTLKGDLKNFNPHCHATFVHIMESTASNGACNLHLPWLKTQKARGDDIWIPQQEPPLDPIHAIHKHFIKNWLMITHPISAYRDASNNIITLTRTKFIRRVPPDMVKKFGRWRSHAFLEYWHCLDYLGGLHINMLPLNPQPCPNQHNYPKA